MYEYNIHMTHGTQVGGGGGAGVMGEYHYAIEWYKHVIKSKLNKYSFIITILLT